MSLFISSRREPSREGGVGLCSKREKRKFDENMEKVGDKLILASRRRHFGGLGDWLDMEERNKSQLTE